MNSGQGDAPGVAVGVVLPTREAVLFHGGDPSPVLEQAQEAESLGFDSVWVGDSLTARPRFEPLTLLAAVAAKTTTVRLGTAVLLAALRHPALLAHQVATVDRIAAGRLVIGVGAGAAIPATEEEFDVVGVPFGERVGRLHATARLLRHSWGAGRDNAKSRYWTAEAVELQPSPAQVGGPPLWLAGDGPQTLRRTGESFDGWLPTSASPEDYARGLSEVGRAAAAAGRSADAVTAAVYLTVTVDDDERRAGEEQATYIEAYYGAPYDLMRAVQGCCAGNEHTVRSWLDAYVEAGARHLVLRPGSSLETGEQVSRLSTIADAVRTTRV